jgi:hypothetical protein
LRWELWSVFAFPLLSDVSSLDLGWECWNVRRLGVT